MKYVQPIGAAADAPYIDADPGAGAEGSPVPAAAIEHPMREIEAVIIGAGLAPDEGDLTQLRQAIQQMLVAAQKAVIINNATFEASVANGEAVRWDAGNTRFDEAIADGTANNRAVGIADVTNSKVYIYGECPLFAGLTPGARYYLDAATPGALTTVAPADGVVLGIAKSATTLFVDIDSFAGNGVTAPQFNNDTKLATTAFVQRALGAASGLNSTNVSVALGLANVGNIYTFYGSTAGQIITLPAANLLPTGAGFWIPNQGSVSVQVSRAGADNINVNSLSGATSLSSITLNPGDSIFITSNSLSQWNVFGICAANAFPNSLASSGYQKLPNGLIMQWGQVSTNGGGDTAVTFPISFPNAPRAVSLGVIGAGVGYMGGFNTLTSSGMSVGSWSATAVRAGATVHYVAIGN